MVRKINFHTVTVNPKEAILGWGRGAKIRITVLRELNELQDVTVYAPVPPGCVCCKLTSSVPVATASGQRRKLQIESCKVRLLCRGTGFTLLDIK